MRWRFRPPPVLAAAVLLGTIAVLATLQYRWVGRISDAEREQTTAMLQARAAAFADDFDREITLAHTLFHLEPFADADREDIAGWLAVRSARWRAAARHPQLLQDIYSVGRVAGGAPALSRYVPASGALEAVPWPAALSRMRDHLEAPPPPAQGPRGRFVVRVLSELLWEDVPALLVPMPLVFAVPDRAVPPPDAPSFASLILVLDAGYIAREMLPGLARQHFRGTDGKVDYRLSVVSARTGAVIFHTGPRTPGAPDVSAPLFRVRPQEFSQVVADVRRFVAASGPGEGLPDRVAAAPPARERSILATVVAPAGPPHAGWRLHVTHPSGSLERAVAAARRRNLAIGGSILGVLAASLVLVVVSARRSQELARQQMEFVAAVSHELRTPLAVIRSAGDNLADGVVQDAAQVRRYGSLVRDEGRRLTDMVEQILELSGIQSGQRALARAPVRVQDVVDSVLGASEALLAGAGLRVERSIPPDLPPVAGDEAALRRVFQNLVANAIKYGARGGWLGLAAETAGPHVLVRVSDRGIGIDAADQPRIFEPFFRAPDVIAARFQGAGLGLSLVRRILEAHGGDISVHSAKGSGSVFTVRLPVFAGAPVPDPARALSPS